MLKAWVVVCGSMLLFTVGRGNMASNPNYRSICAHNAEDAIQDLADEEQERWGLDTQSGSILTCFFQDATEGTLTDKSDEAVSDWIDERMENLPYRAVTWIEVPTKLKRLKRYVIVYNGAC
jgi:hypothetical protein